MCVHKYVYIIYVCMHAYMSTWHIIIYVYGTIDITINISYVHVYACV